MHKAPCTSYFNLQGALALAQHDIQGAGLARGCIKLHLGDAATMELPDGPPSLVVTNPPW